MGENWKKIYMQIQIVLVPACLRRTRN